MTNIKQPSEEQIARRVLDHLAAAGSELDSAVEQRWPKAPTQRKHLIESAKHVLKHARKLATKIKSAETQ
jgi:hypothetical protein